MNPSENFNDLTYEVKCNLVNDFNEFIANHKDPAGYCIEIDLGTAASPKISQYQRASSQYVFCKDNTVVPSIQPVPMNTPVNVFNSPNFITWVKNSKLGSGQLSEVYFYDDFEILEYEQKDLEWESINEITAECLENPINPKIQISLQNFPDYDKNFTLKTGTEEIILEMFDDREFSVSKVSLEISNYQKGLKN